MGEKSENIKVNYCLLSNDVETHSIRFNKLRAQTGYKVYKDAIPRILDLYDEFNVKGTFFFTGYFANLIPDAVKIVANKGHENGWHGLVHDVDKAFDVLAPEVQVGHLKKAKHLLEDISGKEVISFRAPALRIDKHTPGALQKAGFRIDSSISPQRLDFLLSFGSSNKFQRIFSPRKPYVTKPDNLAFRGHGQIIEMPLSGLLLPLVGSTMRVFPLINTLLQTVLLWESKSRNIPIISYLHPTEFIDESNEPFEKIAKRTNNIIKYLLADVLRHKLKTKNLGPVALKYYSNQIKYFANHNYKFVTMSEYCKEKGLLQ